ncbi:Oxoglutarate dehydrogenase inhibitor [Thermoflexales bacterium]|nr:Oxoglutarate dehydrogenase inhibitor [Thermoflexales bacterium]
MSTNFFHLLTNIITPHNRWPAAPLWSTAAQSEISLPLIVGGLILLLLIALVLFWRLTRKPPGAPPEQPATPEKEPAQIVVPPPPLPMTISLEFTTESGECIRLTLDKPTLTIGRAADNDIVLAPPISNTATVSQHHARLRRDQEDYIVRDLGSKNGLAVNGRQTLENLLQDGDRLKFGEVEAIFHQAAGGAA